MPRRARIPRAEKPKPAPTTYVLSDEIAAVAAALFGRFEAHYMDLRQFRIAWVMVLGGRPPTADRIDGNWAGISKQTPLLKSLHEYDLILWIRESIWKRIDARQREALVAHQLDHYTTNDKGELVAQRHDVEDFAFVARQWGMWHESIELYGRQLSLFGQPEGKGEDPHAGAFADLDARAAEQKAEGNITPLRRSVKHIADSDQLPGGPA